MEYKGAGLRLHSGELESLCEEFNLTEAHGKTVIDVETSGKGFNAAGWVEFLFEPHVFYKNVPKDKQAEAIRKGLAYPSWRGPGSYPKSLQLRITQFQQAAALDETAAIKSASWGLGQIMGSECVEAGYPTPQAMLEAFKDSEANQVRGMLMLIKHRGLDKDLRNFPEISACRHFALRYNGAAYAKNNYHNKLHDAFIRNSKAIEAHGTTIHHDDGTIRFGDIDPDRTSGPVRKMQERFKSLGYSLKIDGNFGGGTRTTVLAWKANSSIDTSSSDMSPADLELLKQAEPMPIPEERANATVADLKPSSSIVQESSFGKKILGWTGGITGIATASGSSGLLDSAENTVDKARQAKGVVNSVQELAVDSGVVGLVKVIYEWRFPVLFVVVVAAFFIYSRIQKRRLEMHQKAEIG